MGFALVLKGRLAYCHTKLQFISPFDSKNRPDIPGGCVLYGLNPSKIGSQPSLTAVS